MPSRRGSCAVTPVPVDGPEASRMLWSYFYELSSRYNGRPSTPEVVESAMAEEPSDDLTAPHGLFLLARLDERPAGCAGLRRLNPVIAEVTRLFVHPEFRNRGFGGRLLSALEDHARELGATALRLDTRHDLVEARNLYVKQGFVEIPAYSHGPYAEHWFEKKLAN